MNSSPKANTIVLYMVFFASICAIGLLIERHQTTILFLAYFSSFFSYLWLVVYPSKFDFSLGLAIRIALFFSLPSLSDDLYRFLWDGDLLNAGIHPFSELPTYYSDRQDIPGINSSLFNQLNSPEYFTIYPPLNQFIFWLAAKLSGEHWLIGAAVIRTFLLIGDLISYYFLRKILIDQDSNEKLANLYFLNPLVILEGVGNLHFEVLVIGFLLIGIYYFNKNIWKTALGFGLAIGTKLLPLIFLPAILFQGQIKKRIKTISIILIIAFITFIPMMNLDLLLGMQKSMSLYFQKFEFNASIYFLLREIGFWIKGYNIIGTLGPILSMFTFVLIMCTSLFLNFRKKDLAIIMFVTLMIYLSFSIIVHPWYIIPLIALGVIIQSKTALVWSFFIFFTYFGYTETGFELSMYWVVLEYVVVFSFFFYEFFYQKYRVL